MLPKESKSRSPFTGFYAYYNDGKIIKEREFFFSKKLNKHCATNWAEIDRDKLIALELRWKGEVKARVDRTPSPTSFNKNELLTSGSWFFSQKGYLDMGTNKIKVIARNIGYIEDGIINIISVVEETGAIQIYRRKS